MLSEQREIDIRQCHLGTVPEKPDLALKATAALSDLRAKVAKSMHIETNVKFRSLGNSNAARPPWAENHIATSSTSVLEAATKS